MKKILLILLLIIPIVALSQRTFKFTLVDEDTGAPLAKKWGTILVNGDRVISFTNTDANGVCTFNVRTYDSSATYQVEYTNKWDNHIKAGVYDITSVKYRQPVVKIKTLTYAMPFSCGEVMYAGYHPKTPTSLIDLPVNIQQKVKQYFTDRVGKKFYKQLVLNGGQVIDLKRFHQVDTFYKEDPPVYSLCYMVWDSVKHLNLYCFSLKLNADGKLLGKVLLPDIKHNPSKGRIMNLDEAKEIALRNNFFDERTATKTYYYLKNDCIVWEFEQTEPGEGKRKQVKLLIDAHNGEIVDKITSEVYVMI